MKTVIEIVKRYLVEIICGLAAIGGVVFIFLGLGSMGQVKTELESASRVKDQISSMMRGPALNELAVKQQQARIADIRAGFAEVMDYVRQRNFYKPLVDGAFPGGESAAKDRDNAIAFRDAYNHKMKSWLDALHAGDVPSEAEIAAERDRMEQQLKTSQGGGIGVDNRDRDRDRSKTEHLPMDPEVGASIGIARKIYCYANPSSFQRSRYSDPGGPMDPLSPPPNLTEMWEAQLEVWIEDTVVQAVANVNDRAASALESKGETPWVGNLPIKDIRSLQTTQYYVLDKTDTARGSSGSRDAKDHVYPPGTQSIAFTGHKSDKLHELMQFTVQLVVDARAVPEVIAGLCDQRFHVPLDVRYTAIPPNTEMMGKIYGEDPVIELTIDFETVMFSELYLPLMPQEILDRIGKKRPEAKKGAEA